MPKKLHKYYVNEVFVDFNGKLSNGEKSTMHGTLLKGFINEGFQGTSLGNGF